jgi:hypothetical protein
MDDKPLPALWGRIRAEELAQLTGAHLTSARRWKRLITLPRWLAVLVRTVFEGELADVSREFAGWRLRRGELVSPEGWRFTPGAIRALPFLRQQISAQRAQQPVAEVSHTHHARCQQQRAQRLNLGRITELRQRLALGVADHDARTQTQELAEPEPATLASGAAVERDRRQDVGFERDAHGAADVVAAYLHEPRKQVG